MDMYCSYFNCRQCVGSLMFPEDCRVGEYYFAQQEGCYYARLAEFDNASDEAVYVYSSEATALLMGW